MSKLTSIEINQLLKSLNNLAPLYLAQKWDNVGLLIRPTKTNKILNLLLTNDLTENVINEAINKKVDFIFSYHPPIFQPLKSVNHLTSWKENIVIKCIVNAISVYSPHTALDSIDGGICDWMIEPFKYISKTPIEKLCNQDGKTVLENVGLGRYIVFDQKLSIQIIVDICKKHFNIPYLRLALSTDHMIDSKVSSIAVCPGSGFSVLKNVQADIYITGEMSHHQVLDFNHKRTTVILTEHSNCERGYLKIFANMLLKEIGNDIVNVMISEKDQDPLTVI